MRGSTGAQEVQADMCRACGAAEVAASGHNGRWSTRTQSFGGYRRARRQYIIGWLGR